MFSVRSGLIAILFLLPAIGFSQSMLCRQAHRAPDWLRNSLNPEQLKAIGELSSGLVNNEASGYHLLKSLPEGGNHLGLGGDFNYTIMGTAKSSGGIIYDFDPNVIVFHQLIRSAVLMAETPEQFRNIFDDIANSRMSPADQNRLMSQLSTGLTSREIYRLVGRSNLPFYFMKQSYAKDSNDRHYTYLGDQEVYSHVRNLFLENKIQFALKSQFDPHVFRDLSQNLGLGPFSTYYVSNAIEFRWLDIKATKDDVANMMKALKGWGDSHDNLPKVYDKIESQMQSGSAGTKPYADLRVTQAVLDSLRRGLPQWTQFWKNLSEVSWSEDAVMLTTSRDWGLFGSAFNQVQIEKGTDMYRWVYATLPKQLWFTPELSQAANQFYENMRQRYEQLLTGRVSPSVPTTATFIQEPSRTDSSVKASPASSNLSWPYK